MKIFSMFSGVGGFEYGIQNYFKSRKEVEKTDDNSGCVSCDTTNALQEWRQSATCVGYSEIDKYATAVYEYHYGGTKNYGDATKINAEELPDFDVLVGGFPCQAFSVAGKRRGFEDTRGTLFFDIARIAKQKRPRLLVLENVKGLLSHDKGNTFLTILTTLDEMGYDAEWEVLNSKHFGVPQNRERVFIVARLRGTGGRQIFPLGQSAGEVDLNPEIVGNTNNAGRGEKSRVYGANGIMTTLTATDYKQPKQLLHSLENLQIRKLTPVECERLQGFPDDWTKYGVFDGEVKEISDTQRYKMMGNAVTTNVITAIFEKLLEVEGDP